MAVPVLFGERNGWMVSRESLAPNLILTLPKRVRNQRTVFEALQNRHWVCDLRGGLTVQVRCITFEVGWPCKSFWSTSHFGKLLSEVVLQPDTRDSSIWKRSPLGSFSTRTAYHVSFIGQLAVAGAHQLWKVRAPNKCHFYILLVIHGRCWTSERLQ
uniref:Reverse transcriptase zinc-binding domain-containing protein n=1 Tax=Arundo donax TaxID=35708 RepID=A0A0A9HI93_ARUDO